MPKRTFSNLLKYDINDLKGTFAEIEQPPIPISAKIEVIVNDDEEFLMIDEKKFTYQFFREFDVENLTKALEFYDTCKGTLHLCDSCTQAYPECDGQPEFGTGFGNDNIYKCPQHESIT